MASHRSEMVSQLLFGESYRVIQASDEWVEITTDFDHYHGFIAANQHEELSEKAYADAVNSQIFITPTTLHVYDEKHGCRLTLAPASTLRLNVEGNIQLGDSRFIPENPLKQTGLTDVLCAYEGTSYLWGGRTPWGIDCSGFTQAVFKTQGISLPRDASQQALQGTPVTWEDSDWGDLAFFQNEKGNITHVGMVLSGHRILHCSGRVRNDWLDPQGIYCEERRLYTHRLHSIKHITQLKYNIK